MKKRPQDSNEKGLFSAHQHGQDGPIIFRYSEEDDSIKPPIASTIDKHQRRIDPIKKAVKSAIAFKKGERMAGEDRLDDWQIAQRGKDPDKVRENMRKNWQELEEHLGEAALYCKWYKDGSCEINCDPIKFYGAHNNASNLHRLEKTIVESGTRC